MKFKNTVKDFGDEWEKFDNEKLETKQQYIVVVLPFC